MDYPDYWPKSGWSKGWGENGTDAENDLDDANKELQNALDGANAGEYYSAKLALDTPEGRAISTYITHNLVTKKYTSQSREATRMEYARWLANDPKAPDDWRDAARARLREGKKGGPKPPKSGAIAIRKIKILRNPSLWAGYCAMREVMKSEIQDGGGRAALKTIRFTSKISTPGLGKLPVLDAEVGETLLFHGTTKEVMKLIAKGGFDPSFCKNKGSDDKPNYGALGQGTYFSDSFAKVMTYTMCRQCGAYQCDCTSRGTHLSKRVTFLSRVLLGAPKNVRALGQRGRDKIRQDDISSLEDTGRRSVYAKGYTFGDLKFVSGSNEFGVKDGKQTYPEFVIYWVHAS